MKTKIIYSIVFLVCLASVVRTFAQAPTNGLVAYYPFTGNANDASGNNRNGTISGGVTSSTDRYGNTGQAYSFNGSNGNITVTSWKLLTVNSPRTLSTWFKTAQNTSSGYMISWGTPGNTTNTGSILGISATLSYSYLGFFGINNDLSLLNASQYFDNHWHLMTFTYDGSVMNLYLDGVLQSSKTNSPLNTGTSGLIIGSYLQNSLYFNGQLDEVRVYNRALSQAEVQQLYLAEVSTTTTSDILKIGTEKFIHTTGTENTFVGLRAGAFANGSRSTFVGRNTGLYNTGIDNSFYGLNSGRSNTTGYNNTFIGKGTGEFNTLGNENTYIGMDAGWQSLGNNNVAVGRGAGGWSTTGNYNVFMGFFAGLGNQTAPNTGTSNVFIGAVAGQFNTSGSYNTFLGSNTGYQNTTGKDNTFIGHAAGNKNTTGESNTFLGLYSGYNNTTGYLNTFAGRSSGEANVTGRFDTFMGHASGLKNIGGDNNAFFGYYAGSENTNGIQNTYLGSLAGQFNVTGNSNTFLGFAAGLKNTDSENVFIGRGAGAYSTTGTYNTYVGVYSGLGVESSPNIGSYNTFLGYKTGFNNTTGQNNVFIGWASGLENTTGSGNVFNGFEAGKTNTTGSNNLYLGNYTNGFGSNASALQRSAAIGHNAKVSINDAIVLGDFGNSNLKVGIGIHNPQYRLDVNGTVNMRIGFNSPAMKVNDKEFLALDERGYFVLPKFKIKYSNENEWSDKVFEPNYPLKPIEEVAKFARENQHLPNMPTAKEVVKGGVEMQTILAKFLEKIEEQILYIDKISKENKALQQRIEDLEKLIKK